MGSSKIAVANISSHSLFKFVIFDFCYDITVGWSEITFFVKLPALAGREGEMLLKKHGFSKQFVL